MATDVTADTYLQQIHTARTQLLEYFRRAHELLAEREAHLLRQLETIQNDYEARYNSMQDELQGLQTLKNDLHKNSTLTAMNKALEDVRINEQMKEIIKLSSGTAHTIRFQWNTDFNRDLQQAGEIITQTQTHVAPPIPPRTSVKYPVLACCKHNEGNAPGELYQPKGIAVEPQSGRIYIAEYGNNRVQVFTPDGEYSLRFSMNMYRPWGICINNKTVYVSQLWGHCIVLYYINGAYVKKVGIEGSKNGNFMFPTGIAVSPTTRHLYVCDSDNNRVQIFDNDLKFHSILSNNIDYPSIKLTNELVIVLDVSNPCIHIFSITDHSLINNVISHCTGGQISYSQFFTLDAELNLLLTDCNKHCVKIFSLTGEFKDKIGKEGHAAGEFIKPTGIAIDGQNRIIVVSENRNTSLQIFIN